MREQANGEVPAGTGHEGISFPNRMSSYPNSFRSLARSSLGIFGGDRSCFSAKRIGPVHRRTEGSRRVPSLERTR